MPCSTKFSKNKTQKPVFISLFPLDEVNHSIHSLVLDCEQLKYLSWYPRNCKLLRLVVSPSAGVETSDWPPENSCLRP